MQKKRQYIPLILLLLGLVGTLGGTYALYTFLGQGTKQHSITTGTLSMTYQEDTNGITLEGALPTTDQTGKALDQHFDFTVAKTGTVTEAVNYEIAAKKEAGNTIDGGYIKLYLTEVIADSEIEVMAPKTYQEVATINNQTGRPDGMMPLATGMYESGNIEKHYRLRMWVSEEYNPQGDGGGLTFSVKVNVYGKIDALTTKPNEPVLADNMIPIIYNEAKTRWEKADINGEWYNYDNQMWANAVTVTNDTRTAYQSAAAGTEVKMPDILTMFVWIPRYSYTIKSEDGRNYYGKGSINKKLPGEIDIKFIGADTKENGGAKYTGDTTSGWFTPPAFTFGEKELPGIWVGKFETGSVDENSPGNVTTNNLVAIKPNITSWRGIQVSTLDLVSRGMTLEGNIYGFDNTYDSHAMKNSEWALVSYLTQSKYGKYGNSMYEGESKEIYINNYTGFKTGCSAGAPSAGSSSTCTAEYDDIFDRGNGTGAAGSGASTTGNIYGIYDMSGGAWEYTMGSYNQYSGYTTKSYTKEEAQQLPGHSNETNNIQGPLNSGYTGMCGYDGREWTGRGWPDAKYYDVYTSNDPTKACNGEPCKGHALNEMAGWYNDSSHMVDAVYPWSLRGGLCSNGGNTGVFYFSDYSGNAHYYASFRVVLVP